MIIGIAIVGGMVGGATAFFLWLRAINRQLKRGGRIHGLG